MANEITQPYIVETLIGAIVVLGGVVAYLFKVYQKSIENNIELAKAGFVLAEKVSDLKDQSKETTAAIASLKEAIIKNSCQYVEFPKKQ